MVEYKFCYVILHYISFEETSNCIDCILELDGRHELIVVDNASPNDSLFKLMERYEGNNEVHFFKNDKNLGFASGNNVGVEMAKKMFDPDFIVVLNNDVQIEQKNFEKKITNFYCKNRFDVLGPDIFSTSLHIHQNPKKKSGYTYSEVSHLVSTYQKKNVNELQLRLQSAFRKMLFLKRLVNIFRSKKNGLDFSRTQWGVVLHGACLIFSKDYYGNKDKCFFDGTFMYFETEILQYELERDHMLSVFFPNVRVKHHQNVSTDMALKKSYEQLRFKNSNMLVSLLAFKKYMEKDGMMDE